MSAPTSVKLFVDRQGEVFADFSSWARTESEGGHTNIGGPDRPCRPSSYDYHGRRPTRGREVETERRGAFRLYVGLCQLYGDDRSDW